MRADVIKQSQMAPYSDAGTLFPRSVCRDSRTETLGEQAIWPKPGQAPAWGTASGDHREPLSGLPQPATETTARAPEPWCLRRRTCKILSFEAGLKRTLADGKLTLWFRE